MTRIQRIDADKNCISKQVYFSIIRINSQQDLILYNRKNITVLNMLQQSLTGKILKAYYKVYNTLGFGFLEKVYENALYLELMNSGIQVSKQYPIHVYYEKIKVGEYFADLMVENRVIIELKAAESICPDHEYQLINYLKATEIEVGLLLNFGRKPEFRRKIFTQTRDQSASIR